MAQKYRLKNGCALTKDKKISRVHFNCIFVHIKY